MAGGGGIGGIIDEAGGGNKSDGAALRYIMYRDGDWPCAVRSIGMPMSQ